MDDGPSADLVDVSPIGSPDRFRLIVEQRWRTEEPQSDAESEDTSNIAGDANHRRGSPRWLPRPLRGLRGLKHLTLDIDSPPTFPYSPGYPSIVESAPSSSPCTPDYFDLGGDILLPPAKFDDNMRFHRFPHLSIHEPEGFDDACAWDPHSRFPPFWDAGDDSDGSESPDSITFADQSTAMAPEFELVIRKFDSSEPSPFALDFPEDVGESLEHDAAWVDGDPGMIDRLGRPTPVSASRIPAESPTKPHKDSPTRCVYASDILLPRIRKLSEGGGELESLPHLRYPEADATDVPINVPPSPFNTDGFPDGATSLYSGLAGGEVGEISMDVDWLGGLWGEMIWGVRGLEEEPVEWNRWCEQVGDELDRDLNSWVEVRESARAELDR